MSPLGRLQKSRKRGSVKRRKSQRKGGQVTRARTRRMNGGRMVENAVLFVGSGFSIPARFPNWMALLQELARRTRDPDIIRQADSVSWDSGELYALAQTIRDHENGEWINTQLEEILQPTGWPVNKEMQERLDLIRELDSHSLLDGILTTNYDLFFRGPAPLCTSEEEKKQVAMAFSDLLDSEQWRSRDNGRKYGISDGEQPGDYLPSRAPIIQIHGNTKCTIGTSVVLTTQSYDELKAVPGYMSTMQDIFNSKTVIFIGYSLTDDYVRELVQNSNGQKAIVLMPQRDIHNFKRQHRKNRRLLDRINFIELPDFDDGTLAKIIRNKIFPWLSKINNRPSSPVSVLNQYDILSRIGSNQSGGRRRKHRKTKKRKSNKRKTKKRR